MREAPAANRARASTRFHVLRIAGAEAAWMPRSPVHAAGYIFSFHGLRYGRS
jgi:hypothetical protein